MFYISTTSDYAVLSALTYNDIRINIQNREVLPPSWVELTQFTVDGSGANASFFSGGGFSAKAFQNTSTGVVVISYAGTEATFSKGLFTDFAMANIPAAIGLAAPQAVAAANFYQLVASSASVAGAPITFTGHSLGGGLAAMMSVLFDRPSRVFAPAPFQHSVNATHYLSPISAINIIKATLALNAVSDPTLLGVSPALANYSHLHAATLMSGDFATSVELRPSTLAVMFDSDLYGYGPTALKRDFLIQLVNHQVTQERSGTPETGLLNRFATELTAIGAQSETSASKATLDTVLALTVEWYYWAGTSASSDQKFLNLSEGVLQFTPLAASQISSAEGSRALAYSALWVTTWEASPYRTAEQARAFLTQASFEQWNVSSTTAATSASAQDFNGIFGADEIIDANGDGRIRLNGVELTGGRSAGKPNTVLP